MKKPKPLPARISLLDAKPLRARVSLLLLAAALAAATGWYSFKVLRAELHVLEVQAAQARWAAQGTLPSLAEWQQSLAELDAAIDLNPNAAEYHRLRGLLQEWRSYSIANVDVPPEDILTARRLAVIAYRELTRLRPTDALGWSHLARLKMLAGERDTEFKQALSSAIKYGPNQDYIHRTVSFIATQSWTILTNNAALFAEVKAAILRGLEAEGSRREVLAFLNESALLAEFCVNVTSLPTAVQSACEPPQ